MLHPVAQAIITVAAVLTAITVIGTTLTKAFRWADKIQDSWQKINEIAAQFAPNGGSSLVDRVTRLEVGQNDVLKQLEKLLTDKEVTS